MDDNKQIIDMTLDIMNETSFTLELSGAIATDLYEKGWRKSTDGNDVAEVKHGEWRQVYQNKIATVYECSNCQHLSFGTSEYCICGAKMDGEKTYKFLSSAEVSKMSSKEVKENYANILRSMKDWNLR